MKYVCDVCGWEYDEEKGYPEGGIAPGTKWKDIPDDFECPLSSIPMLVVFKDGKAVAKSVGYRPKPEIAAMVEGAR